MVPTKYNVQAISARFLSMQKKKDHSKCCRNPKTKSRVGTLFQRYFSLNLERKCHTLCKSFLELQLLIIINSEK